MAKIETRSKTQQQRPHPRKQSQQGPSVNKNPKTSGQGRVEKRSASN